MGSGSDPGELRRPKGRPIIVNIEDARDAQFARLQQQVADGIPGARDQRDALIAEVVAEAESLDARVPDLPAPGVLVVSTGPADPSERLAQGAVWRQDRETGQIMRIRCPES